MMNTARQPTVFVSHGSPMMAVEDSLTARFLTELGKQLDRPKAVIVFSAHFDLVRDIVITAGELPKTIHDFYGFPEPLYQIEYPAHGATTLAKQVADKLKSHGFDPILDPEQGWDHGVWIPLRHMYPDADIPVVQISINSRLGAKVNYQLGQALSAFRDEDVLILGSGGISHNLREVFNPAPDPKGEEKVEAFTEWVNEKISSHDIDALLDYEKQAPYVAFNHPTAEHLMPLFPVLGSSDGYQVGARIHKDTEMRILALDAYMFE